MNKDSVVVNMNIGVQLSIESIEKFELVITNVIKFVNDSNLNLNITSKDVVVKKQSELTLGEVVNLYVKRKNYNLKKNTIFNYITAFRNVFGVIKDSKVKHWKNVKLSDVTLEFIMRYKVSCTTSYEYIRRINYVFSWLCKNEYISQNPIYKYLGKIRKYQSDTRPALGCEQWIDEIEARKKLSNFFNSFKGFVSQQLFNFVVFHFIIGTRITETFNYIKAVQENYSSSPDVLSTVDIRTKTTKKDSKPDFRIPVPVYLYEMIVDNKKLYSEKSIGSIESILRRIISRNYKNKFCLHGTRAIYRTAIDFLDKDHMFSENEKESYINHKTDNYIQRRYRRNDFLIQRMRIMNLYASFIYSCAGLVGEQKKVDDYVKAFNQRINGIQQGGMPQQEECQAR